MLSQSEILVTLNLIPGLGPVRIQSLLEHFGSAELVLEAPARLLAQVPRIGAKLAEAIADWRNCTNVHAELEYAAARGVRVVTLLDDDYPTALRRMSDPPIVLYVLGEWRQDDARRGVSIVGTRQATGYGISQARHFGRELAEQASCCIISGLARGIDTAGHLGALDAGGRTIAVLGNGLSSIFPPENTALVHRILQKNQGAIVSEFPMNVRPSRITFPQRNRIVAAWSRATLVIEAPQHSGALHTAGLAASHYGNTVFALPGQVDSPTSQGCHTLIRDGATLCSHPQELISDMGWDKGEWQPDLFDDGPTLLAEEEAPDTASATSFPASTAFATTSRSAQAPGSTSAQAPGSTSARNHADLLPSQRTIIDAILRGSDTLDQLCTALGSSTSELAPALIQLIIAHHLITLPGGRYQVITQ